MLDMPVVCKFLYSYPYAKKLRKTTLYAVLLEYTPERKAYYAAFVKADGKQHGLQNQKWVTWSEEEIENMRIPMNDLPPKVRESIQEQIDSYEEVNKRSPLKRPPLDENKR